MKKLIGIIIFVGLIVFLYTTCPDKTAHTEALAEDVTKIISDQVPGVDENLINSIPQVQGIIQFFGSNMVDVDNYFIFSLGRTNIDDKEQVVSLGIGGHVITFNDKIVHEGARLFQELKNLIRKED